MYFGKYMRQMEQSIADTNNAATNGVAAGEEDAIQKAIYQRARTELWESQCEADDQNKITEKQLGVERGVETDMDTIRHVSL